jgi:hypothetical protein
MSRVAVLAKNKSLSDGIPKAEDGWSVITQINNFVQSLALDPLNTEKGDVYSVLTAVPSPWVRSYMMRNALTVEYITRKTKENLNDLEGMDGLYSALQDEYKGLITCLALYGSRISVEKVVLEFADKIDKDQDSQIDILKKVENIFEISGAFGNMLFEQKGAWGDSRKNKEDYNPPYFQLIHLDNIVIGATSPYSLVYPAAFYDLSNSDIPFYKKGRLRDPLSFLTDRQLEKLFHYLHRLKLQVDDFEKALGKREPILLAVRTFIGEFAQETKAYIEDNYPRYEIKKTGVLDYFQKFSYPFDLAFNMDMKIYRTKDGRYLSSNEGGNLVEFNPDLLLLDSETSNVVLIDSESGYNPSLSTVLKAKGSDGKKYCFALPLSADGLNEFYHELSELLDPDRGDKTLSADFNVENESLTVCLDLTISESKIPFYKRYKVANPKEPLNTNVIIWPNFVSEKWDQYYLYSELVHNRKGIKALPVYASKADKTSGVRINSDKSIYHTTNDDRKHYEREFQADVIVQYDDTKLKERYLNYEIYKSEVPFTGVEIKLSSQGLNDSCCGFVLIKNNSINKTQSVIDYTGKTDELHPVSVGIDFGSTNTSASYSNYKGEQHLISISNRRRFILGSEDNDNNTYALPNELFFFQNDEVNNTIKSALLYHDKSRIVNPDIGNSEAVSGGIPIFERNIKIVDGDESLLMLECIENERSQLLYDLKWKREDKFLVNKKAYLKTVWLYICAELFSEGRRPASLLWSYPSSMPKDLRRTYEGVYEEVINAVNPIKGDDFKVEVARLSDNERIKVRAISESEAVCNYALSTGGVGLGSSSLLVGIDIGGMTSDLLILATDPGDKRAILLKQSSVKIAANKLAKAVGKSKALQKCIAHFVRKNKLELPALEQINEKNAYYLTNLLFEEIEHDKVRERSFYSELWSPENEQLSKDETRGLVAISSYICGLLMFHAGQLVRSVLEEDKQRELKDQRFGDIYEGFYLNVAAFGKGGKLFDWLPTAINEEEANNFYQKCFISGYSVIGDGKSPLKSFVITQNRKHLKMEVGFGLTSPRGAVKIDEGAYDEILGEEGYELKNKSDGSRTPLQWSTKVNANHIFEFGEDLIMPEPTENESGKLTTGLKRFEVFKEIYFDLVKDWDLFDHSKVYHETPTFAQIKLENYVKTDEDWKAGKAARLRTGDDSDFLFSCSPFIYQGMCYLDEVIFKNIYNQQD